MNANDRTSAWGRTAGIRLQIALTIVSVAVVVAVAALALAVMPSSSSGADLESKPMAQTGFAYDGITFAYSGIARDPSQIAPMFIHQDPASCDHAWECAYTYLPACSCGKSFASEKEFAKHKNECVAKGDRNHSRTSVKSAAYQFCGKCGARR